MLEFQKAAPYLSDPLILVGFAVFVFFSFCRYLLKRGIIPQLTQLHGFKVIQLILLYGFLFGIAIIGLGFGLKYRSLSEIEQRKAVSLLKSELETNAAVASQLVANLEKLVGAHEAVTHALRDERMAVLRRLFPEQNLRRELSDPTPLELARGALQELERTGLAHDEKELRKAEAVGRVLIGMLDRTSSTMESLADPLRKRYVFRRTAYESNANVLRRIEAIDLSRLPEAYAKLEQVRANYEVVVANLLSYFKAVRQFFLDQNVDEATLTAVLTAERLATSMLVTFTPDLIDAHESLTKQIGDLSVDSDASRSQLSGRLARQTAR